MNDNLQLMLTLKGVDSISGMLTGVSRNIDRMGGTASRNAQRIRTDFEAATRAIAGAAKALAFKSYMDDHIRPGIQAAADMEEAMLRVKANIVSSTKDVKDLNSQLQTVRDTAVTISARMTFSSKDLVDIQNSLLKAGVPLASITGKAGGAYATAALASLSGMRPEDAADSVGSIGNAFSFKNGKQYSDIANTLVRTDDASAAKVPDLLYNMRQVAASAAQLKVDPNDAVIALGYLDSLGNEAGTSLNRFLGGMAGGTKGKQNALKKSGLEFFEKNADGSNQFIGLDRAIDKVREKFRGMKDEQQKLTLAHKLFGEEGQRAAALFSTKDKSFAEFKNQVLSSADSTTKINIQMEGANANAKALAGTVQSTLASAFDPVLEKLTMIRQTANDTLSSAGHFMEQHKGLTTAGAYAVTGASALAGLYGGYKLISGGMSAMSAVRNLRNGGGIANAMFGKAGSGMPVTVTNWPGEFGGKMKASERMAKYSSAATSLGGAAAGSAAAGGTLATVAAGAAMVAAPGAVAYAAHKFFESDTGQRDRAKGLSLEINRMEARLRLQQGPGYQDKQMIERLEKQINYMRQDRDAILAKLDGVANRPVEVHLDGRVIAESVNRENGRAAGRQ